MKPRRLLVIMSLALLLAALAAPWAFGRMGGGHSYSGGRSSGGSHGGSHGGGGGSGGDLFDLFFLLFQLIELSFDYPFIGVPLDLLIIAGIVWFIHNMRASNGGYLFSSQGPIVSLPARQLQLDEAFDALRRHDPNFSPILFADFAYALYARVQEARGANQLPSLTPYVDAKVIEQIHKDDVGLETVAGVIVGGFRIVKLTDAARPIVALTAQFETNYSETRRGASTTWYNREVWTFVRKADVLSRPPDALTALHCPQCGGALEQNPDGSCKHCGVRIIDGTYDWYVSRIQSLEHENRGPLLTADVPEIGTDWPTIYQPQLGAARQRFLAVNPGFSWSQMRQRVEYIFPQLQAAWSERRWEKARPFVSDCFFQTQQYWIGEYRRQQLRNVLDQVTVEQIEPTKIFLDAFHDALTFRIWASMIDYTANEQGQVLCGSKTHPRRFSEYWTFIRRRGVKSSDKGNANCPNCGAQLKVNMAGVCEYCQGKITSGNFDWVLSRIEQDESYRG